MKKLSSGEEVQKHHNELKPTVDTSYCQEGWVFRLNDSQYHRDDSQYHPSVGEYSSGGVGGFIKCLGHRVKGGDTELENRLKTCSKNPSYISKTSQIS